MLPLTESGGREAAVATRGDGPPPQHVRRPASFSASSRPPRSHPTERPRQRRSTPRRCRQVPLKPQIRVPERETATPLGARPTKPTPGNQPNEANNQPNQASNQPNQANDGEGPAGESNSPQPVDAEQPAAGESLAADAVDDTNRATASGQGPNTNDNGHAPEHQGSTATTITQQAEAGAVATQEGASNSTTTSSGESQTGGGVAQGNGASADVTASTDASVALEQQPGAGSANGQLSAATMGNFATVNQSSSQTMPSLAQSIDWWKWLYDNRYRPF